MHTKGRNIRFLGFLGFFGFLGFDYFAERHVGSLFMFSFFAYFGYFVLAKLLRETPDERFVENATKARVRVLSIPLTALFIVGFCSSFTFATPAFVVLISAIGWTATILGYAFLLYHYETH